MVAMAAVQRQSVASRAPGDDTNHDGRADGWPLMDAGARRRHLASIRALCDDLGRPFDEVAGVYQCELRHLLEKATVADYLPVLAAKRVRQLYLRRMQAILQGDPCAQLLAAK